MNSVRQDLLMIKVRLDQLEKDQSYMTEKLTKMQKKLNEKVGKSGNSLPPTPRPIRLRELDIGKEPEG